MACSIDVLASCPAFAAVMAAASRGFIAGSGPPTAAVSFYARFFCGVRTFRGYEDLVGEFRSSLALERIFFGFVVLDF